MSPTDAVLERAATSYLSLLRSCLTRRLFSDLEPHFDSATRLDGRDWPATAETMIGDLRLRNVEDLVRSALRDGIPGDLIETGVWRGGACILMKAVLNVYGDSARRVWLADSFTGLPVPDTARGHDQLVEVDLSVHAELAVPVEEVAANFRRYGLLDDRVVFLKGWFKDTLPTAAIDRIAVLRLDGDYYESTMDALTHLYPKVSSGGYCIVDDYGCYETCRQAVQDYREANGISSEIVPVDWTGVYWRVA